MFEVLDVTGVLGGEAFLVLSEDDAVLVDTGFMFGARNMIEKIEHALGGRALTYILLTHSHYDHANGVTALLDAFPGAKVVGSAHTARTLGNERIFSGMIELDRNVARSRGVEDLPSPIRSLTVDLVVSEGDVLNTTDMKILVLDTPGHTKGDCSYYFENDRLLAAAETPGIFITEDVFVPAFIVSYQDTLDSIEKLSNLHPSRVLIPHYGLIEGDMIPKYFKNATTTVDDVVTIMKSGAAQGKSREALLDDYRKAYYSNEKCLAAQPEQAFVLNFSALIPRLADELNIQLPSVEQ